VSYSWEAENDLEPPRIGAGGELRFWARAIPGGLLIFGGLLVLLALRLVERPIHGLARPWTGRLVQAVCRGFLRIIGLPVMTRGTPAQGGEAIVANHASWLDIFTLNAAQRIYFVSKSEVAAWPGIGWLARATGTVFINRDRREAMAQTQVFRDRLGAGHRLLFFPEGTSTDGMRVLPFRPTLFEAFFDPALAGLRVQPVTVVYHAPEGRDPRFYGWWGDMSFAASLRMVLAERRQGRVEIVWHPPLKVADHDGRKTLAAEAERLVRSGMPDARKVV